MADPSATAERREQILGEVAEGLHGLFKETQGRAMACEDDAVFVGLADTACNIARGVRQCLGWHAKLERQRLAADRAAAERAELTRFAEVQDRKDAISRKVTRRFNETWPDDDDEDENEVFNQRLEVLSERLDDLAEADDFLDQDPDALIARLCEEFGVEPPSLNPPLIPAKAGTQADSRSAPTPQPPHGLNGHAPPIPDSS